MPCRIENYGLIGDCETAALVGRNGSIDWLCWPAFDSDACFAAILGTHKNGRWLIAPSEDVTKTSRRYLGDTLILETRFETKSGAIALSRFSRPARATFAKWSASVEPSGTGNFGRWCPLTSSERWTRSAIFTVFATASG